MVKLTVDGREIEAKAGSSLLRACLDNGIYIPHLCYLEEMAHSPASCRLCFVEIKGKVVCSCNVAVEKNLVVRTDTEKVRRLQRTALRLLLSVHNAECRLCPSNKRCELQRMAKFLGVRLRPRRLEHIDRQQPQREHPVFQFVPSRCVLCGRCISVCEKRNGRPLLTFAGRGFDTMLTSFESEEQLKEVCIACRACVDVCPVSAIFFQDHFEEYLNPAQKKGA